MNFDANTMKMLMTLKNSSNPEETLQNIIKSQIGVNPFYDNLINLAKSNDSNAIENIARTVFSQKGLDFDKEFSSFKSMLGL